MADVSRIIARMQGQIAELQRRQNNAVRSGRVVDVDPGRQRVKVDIGDEGNPLITPWIRWPERAGARKTWNPPSVGELMTVLSPAGEVDEKSLAVHGGFTNDNPAPSSDGDAQVFTLGPLTVTTKGNGATLQIGGFTVKLSAAGVDADGGYVRNNGTDIGDTHKHDGIKLGPDQTGTPV